MHKLLQYVFLCVCISCGNMFVCVHKLWFGVQEICRPTSKHPLINTELLLQVASTLRRRGSVAVVAAPGGGMDLVWDLVGWLNHRFKKTSSSRAQVPVVLSQRPTKHSEGSDNIHSLLPTVR